MDPKSASMELTSVAADEHEAGKKTPCRAACLIAGEMEPHLEGEMETHRGRPTDLIDKDTLDPGRAYERCSGTIG